MLRRGILRTSQVSTSALAERDQLREVLDAMAPEHPEGGTWTWNTSKNMGAEGPGRNGALRALEVAGVKLDNLRDQTLLHRRDEHPLVAALQDYRKKAQEYSKCQVPYGCARRIGLESPEESAKDAALWLQEKMREAFEEVLGPELGGPKSVDVGYGPSWGEQTELEEE